MTRSRIQSGGSDIKNACVKVSKSKTSDLQNFQKWFADHFSLDGKPYILDLDQARAVLDDHKNTLVTARAGSGKTRIIVAKVAYLLATKQRDLREIAVFMFNRDAAIEVNRRIAKTEFDHRRITSGEVKVASTFHKFALDLMKLSSIHPKIISEAEHNQTIEQALRRAIADQNKHVSTREFDELLKTISGFIARAGQKYAGANGLKQLRNEVNQYTKKPGITSEKIWLHRLALATFENYFATLQPPKLDFNIMVHEASGLLREVSVKRNPRYQAILARTSPLKIILIDEYQDFSQLFLNLVQSLRQVCPAAHLFAVGDDWQAINRFAGSDVDYFINFANYFPEDTINIPLMTNYRSCRRIVENANSYMIANYNPEAAKAIPFSRKTGKIIRLNPEKTRFNEGDIHEDALGDARFQNALAKAGRTLNTQSVPNPSAAKLLKTVFKIVCKNRRSEIMLLHRHNFTTFPGVSIEVFKQALKNVLSDEEVMNKKDFEQQIRCMTMHKSKGLESEIVVLLEANRDLILGHHPNADLWKIFGDSSAIEKSDQHRLLYVAMTRAKQKLYILSSDEKPPL